MTEFRLPPSEPRTYEYEFPEAIDESRAAYEPVRTRVVWTVAVPDPLVRSDHAEKPPDSNPSAKTVPAAAASLMGPTAAKVANRNRTRAR
jgi:hypothetical protein